MFPLSRTTPYFTNPFTFYWKNLNPSFLEIKPPFITEEASHYEYNRSFLSHWIPSLRGSWFFLFMRNYVITTFATIKPSATINYITLGFKTLGYLGHLKYLEHLGTSRALGQLGYLSPLSSWGTLSLKTLEGTWLLAEHLGIWGHEPLGHLKHFTWRAPGHLGTWSY